MPKNLSPTQNRLLLWAVAAGVVGAAVGLLFRKTALALLTAWTGVSGPALAFHDLAPWQRLLLPVIGGWLAGWVLRVAFAGVKEQGGDYLEAVVVGDGRIPVRESLWKSLSAMLTIGSGGSIGKEGPMVQLAALTGSLLGRWRAMSTEELRILTACGGAAGIACAYHAPVAGAIFVAEVALGTLRTLQLAPMVVAAVFSTSTVRLLEGDRPLYVAQQPDFGGFGELAVFLAYGIACGWFAPLYLGGLRLVKQAFHRLPLRLPERMAVGGLVVGGIAWFLPEVAGNGHFSLLEIFQGRWLWQLVAVVVVVKWVATACCFGSGAVGGVFTPTLLTGAGLGFLFGTGCEAVGLLPSGGAIAGAVVGMSALLAAATRAPVMAMLMGLELTMDQTATLPTMLACVAATVIAGRFSEAPLYPAILKQPSPSAAIAGQASDKPPAS